MIFAKNKYFGGTNLKNPSINSKLLPEFFELLDALFSEEEKAEVDHFIQVGEYGLALETIVDICFDEGKKPDKYFAAKVSDLALALEMNPMPLLAKITTDTSAP